MPTSQYIDRIARALLRGKIRGEIGSHQLEKLVRKNEGITAAEIIQDFSLIYFFSIGNLYLIYI